MGFEEEEAVEAEDTKIINIEGTSCISINLRLEIEKIVNKI